MPQLTAPDDLRAIALPWWAKLLPDWDVTMVWGDPGVPGALARVPLETLIPARRLALVEVWPHPPGESLEASVIHEFAHVSWSPLTELIGRSPASIALEEPIVERWARALSDPALSDSARAGLIRAAKALPALCRARLSTHAGRLARAGGSPMNAQEVLAAIREADGAAALTILEAYVAEALAAAMPAAPPAADPPTDGEVPPAMMARALAPVLGRLGAPNLGAALQRIEAGQVAIDEVARLRAAEAKRATADDDAAKVELLRVYTEGNVLTPAQAYDVTAEAYVDNDGKAAVREKRTPKAAWMGGTAASLQRTLSAMGTPTKAPPLAQADAVAIDDAVPAEVASYALRRGITDQKKIAALAAAHRKPNGARAAQGSAR